MAKRFTLSRGDTEYRGNYKRIPSILADVAAQSGSEFIDLPCDFKGVDFPTYFVDPVHLTDEGSHVLTELIVKRSKTLQNLARSGELYEVHSRMGSR